MQLLILEPEHEEEVRQPAVERVEVHAALRSPEDHERTDDVFGISVQRAQKRSAVSGCARHHVLALDQAADEPRLVADEPERVNVSLHLFRYRGLRPSALVMKYSDR